MKSPSRSPRSGSQIALLRTLALASLAGSTALITAACGTEGKPPPGGASSTASAAASTPASASAAPEGSAATTRDEIEPVYPLTRDPPVPLAQKLCATLHELPARRKAECCGGAPGVSFATECVRTLSYALSHGAVTVSEAEVNRCTEAMEASLTGCDWTSPMSPPLPPACDGLLQGTLTENARCRSSLECKEGLRCRGVGPTHVGVCGPPLPTGALCAIAVDPLASFTRQDGYEAHHPECTGTCGRRVCADLLPLGAACETSGACGPKNHCLGGKCADTAAPPAGKPCLVHLCAEGARCVKGMCLTPKANGEACQDDVECRSTCKRGDAGTKGVCGNYCGK